MKKNIILYFIIVCLVISNVYFINHYFEVKSFNDTNSGEFISEKLEVSGNKSGDIIVVKPQNSGEVILKEEPILNDNDKLKEVTAEYDVIVFAAEPEGIAAAISAARNNKKVLLVERRDGPRWTYDIRNAKYY